MLVKGIHGVDGHHQAEGDHNLNKWWQSFPEAQLIKSDEL